MRVWHEKLIPKLCRQHLLACWREGLGTYSIIVKQKKGYSKHPTVLEFSHNREELHARLKLIRTEMLKRGYDPKPLPRKRKDFLFHPYVRWQSLRKQIKVLKAKNCDCNL